VSRTPPAAQTTLRFWAQPSWRDGARAIGLLALGVALVVGALVPGERSVGILADAAIAGLGAVFLVIFAALTRRLLDPAPLLVVSGEGIDPRAAGTIPWADVLELSVHFRRGITSLYIRVAEQGSWWPVQSRSRLWRTRRRLNAAMAHGCQFVVSFSRDELSARDLVAIAELSPVPMARPCDG
jgi:hypothetical protein